MNTTPEVKCPVCGSAMSEKVFAPEGFSSSWKYAYRCKCGWTSPYRLTHTDALASATVKPHVTGDTSDGYHTFNELYHHRAVLFSVVVSQFKTRAWKSKQHGDGTMFDGMFIVGIDTPDGQATYHYDVDPYWSMFDCMELDRAPEWDGHTPAQAIERIASLKGMGAME